MKQRMKKLLPMVLAAVMACSMTVFAAPHEPNSLVQEVDLDQLSKFSESFVQVLSGMSSEEIKLEAELYALEEMDNVAAGFNNYEQQIETLGAFQEITSSRSEKTDDGYITYITAEYEKKTLHAEITYSDDLPYLLMLSQNAYLMALEDTTFTPEMTMSENLMSGLANLLVGMGTVFVVLIFISWVISMLKYVNKLDPANRKKEEPKTAAPAVPAAAPAVVEEELAGDDALVAVITAAIAAYEGDGTQAESLENGLVIRSIRRHRESTWRK